MQVSAPAHLPLMFQFTVNPPVLLSQPSARTCATHVTFSRQVHCEANHTIGNPAPLLDAKTGTLFLFFSRDNTQVLVRSAPHGTAGPTPMHTPTPYVCTQVMRSYTHGAERTTPQNQTLALKPHAEACRHL